MDDIRQKILDNISFRDFYSRYIPHFDYYEGMDTYNIICPFHDDDTPSCSLNLKDGLWYCHSCDIGGSIFDFYMKQKGCDFKSSLIAVAKEFNIDIGNYGQGDSNITNINESKDDVKRCHEDLLRNIDDSLDYVQKERGLSKETIIKYNIGYSVKTKRTTFPIYDDAQNLVNVRQHSKHYRDRAKGFKVIGIKGFNQVRLTPLEALKEKDIYIFAGEFDAYLAQSLGLKGAVTKTGPEKQWYKRFNNYFKDKNVAIIYDNDKAGREGANLIATSLLEIANKVKVVVLPLSNKGEDFTDFIIRYGNTIDDFMVCIKSAKTFKITENNISTVDISKTHDVSLEESSLDKYYFKQVSFKAIVAGKDLNPFLVPKKITLNCDMTKDKACAYCKLLAKKGKYEIIYDENDPDILEFVSASQTQKIGIIKKKSGINNCNIFSIDITEASNIEECFLVPAINFKDIAYEDTYRKVFYLGQGLSLNQVYDFNGITVPDPRDQHSVIMINDADSSDTDIDSFTLDDELKKKLKDLFSTKKTKESIAQKFKEKYDDLSENVIQIYDRIDLMIAIDLVYHSALKFRFQNVEIEKSHVEALIIGDTRTGKSVTAKRLINHYRLGEIINCEKATIPGLIGGTYDLGSRKILTWGIIPRNDRRLVILDEADGIDTETISNLSGIRSSCIAERTIAGGTRKALARTRMLWIANPRGFKNLSEYTTGIEAVKSLIGKPEDIARFDFCLAISQKDVPVEIINKKIEEKVDHKFTSHLCNKLLLWGWSRKEKDIVFTEDAINSILKYAVAFGKIFSADIPIVHPNEQRIKIARLAASVAIATFSTDDGVKLIVDSHHVEYVVEYLMDIYSNPILSYTSYSKVKINEQTVENEEVVVDKIKNGFSKKDDNMFEDKKYNSKYFIERMLGAKKIKFDDIMDALQAEGRDEVRECRQFLMLHRCLRKEHSYWLVTEPFRNLLRKIQKDI
jgi:hypothetical protein